MSYTRVIDGMTFCVNELLTPDTLIKISMAGGADTMTCLACSESAPIPFIDVTCGKTFRKGNPTRDKIIKEFKATHLRKCMTLPDSEVYKYTQKRAL